MKYGGSGKKDIDIDDVVNAEQKLHHHGGLVQSGNVRPIIMKIKNRLTC